MKKHFSPASSFTTVAILAAASLTCQAAPQVSFTLSLNTAADSGGYFNLRESDKGTNSVYAIGFQIKVNSIDGVASGAAFNQPFAAFCTELQEDISTSSYTFDLVKLENVSAGRAGQTGTASYLIPAGGIGADRAAMVRYLFDSHYQSPNMAEWTGVGGLSRAASFQAFQLAVWEVTHDSNLDLNAVTDHGIYVTTPNSVTLAAQTLLNEVKDKVSNGAVGVNYKSTKYTVWGLAESNIQDILIGVPYKSEQDKTLNDLVPVHTPEPGTLALLAFASAATLMRRRRR